jgi:uncharacterized protein YhdP
MSQYEDKRKEVTGGWRKWHKEDLWNILYWLPYSVTSQLHVRDESASLNMWQMSMEVWWNDD